MEDELTRYAQAVDQAAFKSPLLRTPDLSPSWRKTRSAICCSSNAGMRLSSGQLETRRCIHIRI